jgi:nucleoside-diphosphate-sugar epimerase
MFLNIALTGATGFVGSKVVAELLANKHAVTALVRDETKANLPDGVKLVRGDLQNDAALDALTKGSNVVIHIAGLISAVKRQDYFVANEQGTRAVAQAAMRNGVKRFVHVSSLSAREPQLSTYGASKLAGETVLAECEGKLSHVILRPPAVYGPGDKATLPLLKALTQSLAVLPGRADARFSLIHVDDLARIIVDAAASKRAGIVELGDGCAQGHDWKELARVAAAVEHRSVTVVFLPKFVSYTFAFVAEAVAKLSRNPSMISREKINELYHKDWVAQGEGWPLKSPTGFAQGFAETMAWYRNEGWLPQSMHTKIMT